MIQIELGGQKSPVFQPPIDQAIPLWRYMDLSKFIALLQDRALHFARADKMGDPFEGSLPKPTAASIAEFYSQRHLEPTYAHLKPLENSEVEEVLRKLSFHRKEEPKETYINCWHMNEQESAAMWRLYSSSSDAICIQTTYPVLLSLLPDTVFIGIMKYIDYNTEDIGHEERMFRTFMYKRKSFEHEREIRAVTDGRYYVIAPAIENLLASAMASPTEFFAGLDSIQLRRDFLARRVSETPNKAALALEDGGLKVPVNLNVLIQRVFVSPTSPGWFKQMIVNLCVKYHLDAPVYQSSLSASHSPIWCNRPVSTAWKRLRT